MQIDVTDPNVVNSAGFPQFIARHIKNKKGLRLRNLTTTNDLFQEFPDFTFVHSISAYA